MGTVTINIIYTDGWPVQVMFYPYPTGVAIGPYTYYSAGTYVITGIPVGTYNIIFTDAYGCEIVSDYFDVIATTTTTTTNNCLLDGDIDCDVTTTTTTTGEPTTTSTTTLEVTTTTTTTIP